MWLFQFIKLLKYSNEWPKIGQIRNHLRNYNNRTVYQAAVFSWFGFHSKRFLNYSRIKREKKERIFTFFGM